MKPERLLRAILPYVLIDNFDMVNFDKSADRFDIYLDEKKVQLKEDKTNPDIISYGFGEYLSLIHISNARPASRDRFLFLPPKCRVQHTTHLQTFLDNMFLP